MKPKFSGSEVIQLAISMEEEGVKFYEKYAAMADVELKDILLGMAEDERQHAKVFKNMYNELEVNEHVEDYLFSDNVQDFFASYAKSEGFNRPNKPIDSVRDAIKIGIETEKVTIEYYKSLLEFSTEKVKDILLRMIKEEEGHQKRLEELL
jgi:rubrerythrin